MPQLRRRQLLLATRDDAVRPDAATAALKSTLACAPHLPRTLRWAIDDLETIKAATAFDLPSTPTPVNRRRIAWLFAHDRYGLPNDLRPPCHQGRHSYTSMYGRLRWDAPAQTITTGFGSMGQGRYVHPRRPRMLTPHEAARLQTFPTSSTSGSCEPAARGRA